MSFMLKMKKGGFNRRYGRSDKTWTWIISHSSAITTHLSD
jgi:hypothetical protein